MTELTPITVGLLVDDMALTSPMAIAPGTTVLGLDGALPVEHLYPGDRLITRHGARPVTAIDKITLPAGTAIVQLTKNALGGRPDRDLWLPAGQRILIRDWRAQALYGQKQACVAASQLADGEYIRLDTLREPATGFALRFGRPEVFYADGLELASADMLHVPA
ncbi:Hint domain-containing protein [Roseicyclus sp.]|uniref:Hint domain-containing protein n=1 Tax=Roseicyclus sp. TaxID=1914329 RepID=UPI003F6BA09B